MAGSLTPSNVFDTYCSMKQSGTPSVETSVALPSLQRPLVIRGAREHNLKNIDLTLPRRKLIVITGPSGSGKTSLAFDTIYAEGQRRYVESLSAYARQFLERMNKPDVDVLTGLSPAIAIEQRRSSRNPRSTVATQTEIYDYLRLLFARIGRTYSPVSGEEVRKDTPTSVAEDVLRRYPEGTRFYVGFPLPETSEPRVLQLYELRKKGFFRLLIVEGEEESLVDLHETDFASLNLDLKQVIVLVDRLVVRRGDAVQSRLAHSVEQAFAEGGGYAVIRVAGGEQRTYSVYFERDGLRFQEPTPQLFSFNSPLGACPTCQGFGRTTGLDEDLIIPNPDLSLRQGAIAPFRTEQWSAYYRDLVRLAVQESIPIDVPYRELSEEHKRLIWEGKGPYAGIRGFFRHLERHNYKMHYRIFMARFRGYTRCPDCQGYRLRPEALYVKVGELHIGEIGEFTLRSARDFFEALELTPHEEAIAGRILEEIRRRLRYLNEVGLDYLTLDRLANTLSGGEMQRINLATSLGSSLVGSLYILDEPTIGLHPRDNDRLIRILKHLRDIGNTVLVVEHDPEMIRQADVIVDMGPGSGARGGEVVFHGTYEEILKDARSLTGAYLSGRKRIPLPAQRRSIDPEYAITVHGARGNNLKHLTVRFPLGVMVCVTGVSGSGKSTLVHDTLYAGLKRMTDVYEGKMAPFEDITGGELIEGVEMVDQSPIGRSPRSNPVTYIKAFDGIRELMASTEQARIRGLRPGYFSFNVPGGRCETCQGEGTIKIEMQFLADLYLPCEDCKGKRFKKDILEIRYRGKNIADILELTVDEAVTFFEDHPRIVRKLKVLQEVGLGYLQLGQPATTLSGGEAQRIKLAYHLARPAKGHTLYLFDEPTTGLHLDDIHTLLKAFDALVEKGHSVIIVEHNLEVIKYADWVIDLGPEGGHRGGFLVAEGTPEDIARNPESHTGRYLRPLLSEER